MAFLQDFSEQLEHFHHWIKYTASAEICVVLLLNWGQALTEAFFFFFPAVP